MSDRRLRRQRNLDQIEIPADHVMISTDVLGKGGFGTVYIADYNGRNAAAKVKVIPISAAERCHAFPNVRYRSPVTNYHKRRLHPDGVNASILSW